MALYSFSLRGDRPFTDFLGLWKDLQKHGQCGFGLANDRVVELAAEAVLIHHELLAALILLTDEFL